jgi:hypothetical protein
MPSRGFFPSPPRESGPVASTLRTGTYPSGGHYPSIDPPGQRLKAWFAPCRRQDPQRAHTYLGRRSMGSWSRSRTGRSRNHLRNGTLIEVHRIQFVNPTSGHDLGALASGCPRRQFQASGEIRLGHQSGPSVRVISPGHQSGSSVRAISPGHQCRAGPAPFVSAMLLAERGRYCQRVRIDHQRDALTHFGPVG